MLAVRLLLLTAATIVHAKNGELSLAVQLQPPSIEGLSMEASTSMLGTFTLVHNDTTAARLNSTIVRLNVACENADLCSSSTNPITLTFSENESVTTAWFNVTGVFLGRTKLLFTVLNGSGDSSPIYTVSIIDGDVAVLRSEWGRKMGGLFDVFAIVIVVVLTFMMGTQLSLDVILKVLKLPAGPAIGFGCQYLLMPLISYFFARVFLDGMPNLQFSLFAVGCSPGGGASNFWTILLDGNIDLSVTMTFLSNVAALVMMPAWLYTLGKTFYSGRVEIPFFNVIASLLILVIPVCAGVVFIHYKPHLTKAFRKYVKIFTLLVLVTFIPFGIYTFFYIYRMFTWTTVLCGTGLPWIGYLLSYLVATLLCQSWTDRRTIAIEAGIQNTSIAILVCRLSLPEPDSDLMILMPAIVYTFTIYPLLVWFLRRKFCMKKKIRTPVNSLDGSGDVELEEKPGSTNAGKSAVESLPNKN